MATRSKPPVREPGTDPREAEGVDPSHDPEVPGESDVEAAIEAGQSGETHKIAKPKPAVGASKVAGDPSRPPTAPVNAREQMTYEEAIALRAAGKLKRPVLTELGWVVANEVERAPERR